MKEIKTRNSVKDIRTLDRSANVVDRIKDTCVHTKEQTEQTQRTNTESPTGYAEDRVSESARFVSREASGVLQRGKRLAEKMHQRVKIPEHKGTPGSIQAVEKRKCNVTHGHGFAQSGTRRYEGHNVSNIAGKGRGIKTLGRSIKDGARNSEKAIKKSMRSTVKTAGRSVKTAERTSRAVVKSTQVSAKAAVKSAQATAKAARRAAQAAKVATKAASATVKAIAKAVVVTVKATVAAIKGIIAAIAAGGWVAVVIIVVIFLATAILGSIFGIFATEEGYDGVPSMPEVVGQINSDFCNHINAIIDANPHDRLVTDNAGYTSMILNWTEVIVVFDILIATDLQNPTEVATIDDTKVKKLKEVFWNMNSVSYSLSEVEVGNDEETGKSITEVVLTITVSCKTAEDMITYYGFNAERAAQVRELLQPDYVQLFMWLTGSYQDITPSAKEISEITETLPADLSEERKTVVLTAYSLLGKVRYFWGGKSLVLGWDSRWGTPMRVWADDNPSTGTVRPFGLDCSGFVDWVFYNVTGGDYIIGHGGGAIAQYCYCEAITWSDAQPGDLAFYPDCEHVGLVVKNDAGTLTIIHCASGYNNVVMTQHTQGSDFAFVGRPLTYHE